MKTKLLFFILLLFATSGFGQQWMDMMNDPNVNYYDVVREANNYFKTHPTGKGSGWKQFKRWEYEMQFLIDKQGNRIDGQTISAELEAFKAIHALNKTTSVTSNWTELGPKMWNPTSSWNPGVGRITCIAVNPADQNVIYAGSPGGGVWKTTDGGTTWNCLTDNMAVLNIYSITIDPTNSSTIYIGSSGGGMLKSTNGGTTISSSTSGIPTSATIRRIVVDPGNSNIVIAATSSGIYRSANAGSSWTLSASGSFNDVELKPGNGSIVYACGNSFYKSTNNGISFTQITNGISTSGRSFISVTPANANYVYMVQAKGGEFGYLYRSTDNGTSFTTQVTGNPTLGTNYFGYSPDGTEAGGQAGYDMAMCVSTTNAEEVYIGGIIIWKSITGGLVFTAMTEWDYPNNRGYTHPDMHALEYIGGTLTGGGILYTGSDGGIYKSTDGGDNFTDLSIGLGIRQFYRIGGSKTDPARIAAGAQDNGSSILKSGGWIDWLGADGMETIIDYTNANTVYGTIQNGTLFKSTNGGNSTTLITTPASGAWVIPFVIDPNVSSTLYAGYSQVYKSTNKGSTWTAISSLGGGSLTSLAVAPSNSNYIYASNGSNLWVTKNGGTTWSSIITGLSGSIQYITVHKSSPEKVVVTTAGGSGRVYKSTNAGTAWTNISGTLPALSGKCVVYHEGVEEGLYLALAVGVYYRDNTLSDWVPFMTNLPQVQLSELEIHHGIGKIRVATYGRGVWEADLPCSSPVALSVSNITPNSATLSWGSFTGSSSYNVKWRQTGGSWNTMTTSANSLNINSLSGATPYEFTVSTNCSGGTTADAAIYTFTTLTPCSVPTGLTVSDITKTTATLSWTLQDAPSYYVTWRRVGTTTWSGYTVITNSIELWGLIPGTDYEFTVQSNCSSDTTDFTTPYVTFSTVTPTGLADLIIQSPSFRLPGYLDDYLVRLFAFTDRLIEDTVPRVVAGQPIELNCYVSNTGTEDATWNNTYFFLSALPAVTPDSWYLSAEYHSSIAKNSSQHITRQCSIPLNTQLGYHYLLYNADFNQTVYESNENNNLRYIRVYVIGAPNDSIEPPANPEAPEALLAMASLQVYPNPGNDKVDLSFGLTGDAQVELSIYDNLGKKVAEVVHDHLEAGLHVVSYDLSGLADGLYICRLITGSKVETIKLLKE